MKNQFKINYDKRKLKLIFNNEIFKFNLDDGDVGDFWHSFTLANGVIKDINFYQEDEFQTPIVSVYVVNVDKDDLLTIDTSQETVIEKYKAKGELNNYFNHVKDPEMISTVWYDKLVELIDEALSTLDELFIAHGEKSKYSQAIVLKITHEDYQFNLEGGRYLTEITDEWTLIDDSGYQYNSTVLEHSDLMEVIDYLNEKFAQ